MPVLEFWILTEIKHRFKKKKKVQNKRRKTYVHTSAKIPA